MSTPNNRNQLFAPIDFWNIFHKIIHEGLRNTFSWIATHTCCQCIFQMNIGDTAVTIRLWLIQILSKPHLPITKLDLPVYQYCFGYKYHISYHHYHHDNLKGSPHLFCQHVFAYALPGTHLNELDWPQAAAPWHMYGTTSRQTTDQPSLTSTQSAYLAYCHAQGWVNQALGLPRCSND